MLSQRPRHLFRFILAFGAVLAVTFATLLPMCNLMFSCGCNFLGASHCNIHHAAGPMCPWCSHEGAFLLGYAITAIGIAAAVLVSLRSKIGRRKVVVAFIAGIVGYVLTLSLVGLGTALHYHYPTWYGLRL